MRILQLVTRNEPRGAEVFAAQLSEGLCLRGHHVAQAALYRLLPDSEALKFSAVEPFELAGSKKGRLEFGVFKRLRAAILQFQPDVVQANGFHALKFASLYRRMFGEKWALIYRNISLASGWVRSNLQRSWGRWICRPIRFVVSVSSESAADFERTYSIPSDRMVVIRRGVEIPDQSSRDDQRAKLYELIGCSPNMRLLGHIGGFTEEKNHLGLLRAFNRIRQQVADARLVLLGEGPLLGVVRDEIGKAGLKDSVHVLGFREDARELAGGLDLLLLPSHIEGIPGVVLEAAARRVPSVCTDVGGVSEVVIHGRTGMLVKPGDMDGLADAALRVLADHQLCHELGAAAYQLVREQYSMARSVDEFERLYATAIGEQVIVSPM